MRLLVPGSGDFQAKRYLYNFPAVPQTAGWMRSLAGAEPAPWLSQWPHRPTNSVHFQFYAGANRKTIAVVALQ